jgi:hypothetical protein
MRRHMSRWTTTLTQEQYESEVLSHCESAVCKRIELRTSRPEIKDVSRWVKASRDKFGYGYVDLSEATEQERRDYAECQRRAALRPPDQVWYFIARSQVATKLSGLTIFDAQAASLGYSNIDEAEAWRNAWGRLKVEEERIRITYIVLGVALCIILLTLLFFGIHNEPLFDPLRFP